MNFEEYIRIHQGDTSCIQSDTGRFCNWPISECFFGVPPDELYGRKPIQKLPNSLQGIHFYLGSDCENAIKSFVKSKFTTQIERLSIGDSSYALGSGRNYESITRILSEVDFPKLKVFELGIWQLFSNSHCMFGRLGNITSLLMRMPELECLSLFGSFILDSTLTFPRLKDLHISLDDYTTGINGGYLSQDTLNHILESFYPSLVNAFIDLECEENDQKYSIPDLFLSGRNVPALNKIEFTGGYDNGVFELIQNSPVVRNNCVSVHFEQPE